MTHSKKTVRVRFAPSPTGYLHVGGARTALFNYIFAKHHQGQFILRIEDTDEARSTEESLHMQIQDLQWLGLDWDEGIEPITLAQRGSKGPYRQSQRLPIYHQITDKLLQEGKAYYCFLSDEQIEAQRLEFKSSGVFHPISPDRDQPLQVAKERIAKGEKATVRLKTPKLAQDYILHDLVRGEVKFSSEMVGDFVLLRSSGMPVYNFCCAVDDGLMEITHVFRAEEHLNNTLRQLMILEAIGFAKPQFGHFSLILGEDRQKLSKRHGAVSCHEYQQRGFLPEALNNFLSLLGWSHPEGKEIFSISELIDSFTVDRINPSPAVFDEAKFLWMNSMYLRELSSTVFWQRLKQYQLETNQPLELPQNPAWQERAFQALSVKMHTFKDALEVLSPLAVGHFNVDPQALADIKAMPNTTAHLTEMVEYLKSLDVDYLNESLWADLQTHLKSKIGVKGKELFVPLRVSVIGVAHGTDIQNLIPLIERQRLIQQSQNVLKQLAH